MSAKLFTALTIAVAAFFSCIPNGGTITETDTGIVGKVNYADGIPAGNVRVKLFRDTTTTPYMQLSTGASGNYSFDDIAPGMYNVWSENNDSVAAFADSIYVPKGTLVTQDLTLLKGGSVTAIVRLQPGHDPRSASAHALGTQKYSNVDSASRFTVKNLAPGEYTLRLETTIPGYTPTYKAVTIASGVDDTLKDTIALIYTGIPTVAGIQAEYNPFSGVAKLSWNKTNYANFYQYRVYRDLIDAINPSVNPIAARIDTVYYDTLYRDNRSAAIRPDVSYRYRVTLVNKSMKEGEKYDFADVFGIDPVGLVGISEPISGEKFKDSAGVRVVWNASAVATKYRIQVATTPDLSAIIFDSTTVDTAITLPVLTVCYYYVHVKAQSRIGEWGIWGIPISFAVNGGLFVKKLSDSSSFKVDRIIKTIDKGYLIAAVTKERNLYLIAVDTMGNELWRRKYSLILWPEKPIMTVQTSDNGFLCICSLNKNSLFQKSEIAVLKIDKGGAVEWTKYFPDSTVSNYATSVMTAPENDILIGTKLESCPINGNCNYKASIMRINSLGEKIWEQTIDSVYDGPYIAQATSENFVVFTSGPWIFAPSHYGPDTFFMHRYDFQGNNLHRNTLEYHGQTSMAAVSGSGNGKYMLAFPAFMPSSGSGAVITLNESGQLITRFPSPDLNIFDLQATTDGGFILSGEFPGTGHNEGNITKVNPDGTVAWVNDKFHGKSIVVESDGSIVAIGTIDSPNDGNSTNLIPMLIKISPDGKSFEE
jgi:hypothetical protein